MRSFLLYTVILLNYIEVLGQSPSFKPTIEEVAGKFYNDYVTDYYNEGYITFEKRKGNWYVVSNVIIEGEAVPQKKYLYFNGATNSYLELGFSANKTGNAVKFSDFISHHDIMSFNLHPYFGYEGWYKDVIKAYEAKSQPSDDELYSLGRAYSTNAGALVSDNAGYAVKKEIWKLPFKMDCLTPEQISKFEKMSDKAIACFKKLADRNPFYETIVGKIGLKYANEVMARYTILATYAAKFAQEIVLPPGLYTEEQLESARKNLEDCPSNAILFSFGDNDYYPVQYLQKAKGIRRDVYLVNYSLLAVDRYIFRATFPQYQSMAITISTDTSLYRGHKNEIIYVKDSTAIFPMSNLRSFLQNGQRDENGTITMAADAIGLPVTGETKGDVKVGVNRMISLKNTKYITKDQWMLLDIIENLNGRKICFPSLFLDDQLKELNDHLQQKDSLWVYQN